MSDFKTEHPSFVQVQLSRITGGMVLYGPFLRNTTSAVQFTVYQSQRALDADGEVRFVPGKKLIELRMTPGQYAQLVGMMGYYGGVPGTLVSLCGDDIPRLEGETGVQDRIVALFKDRISDLVKLADKAQQMAQDLVDKKSKGKASDRMAVLSACVDTARTLSDAVPFLLEMLGEAAQGIVKEAQIEIESTLSVIAADAGKAQLFGSAIGDIDRLKGLLKEVGGKGENLT